jgi:ribonuclease P protein component
MRAFSFPKGERLLNRSDFVNVNREGKRYHTAHFSITFHKNRLGVSRLGIITSKRTGNAVTRNRIKRLIREFYRLHKAYVPQGCDTLIAAKKEAGDLDFWKVREELLDFFTDKKFGVLR